MLLSKWVYRLNCIFLSYLQYLDREVDSKSYIILFQIGIVSIVFLSNHCIWIKYATFLLQ